MNDNDSLAVQHGLAGALDHLRHPDTIASVHAALGELQQDNPDSKVVTAGMLLAHRQLRSVMQAESLRELIEAQARMMFGIQLQAGD